MNYQTQISSKVVLVALSIAALTCLVEFPFAQGRLKPQAQCSALDKSKPAQYITFEVVDRRAWNGEKYVKGAVLRLTNNSNCTIVLSTPPGVAPRIIKKNGKPVWQEDYDTPELLNGSHINLLYYIRFPQRNKSVTSRWGGDMLLLSKLNSGESFLFSVQLKYLKNGGEIELPFNYESVSGTEAVRFLPSQIPKNALR